jgi:hypothetical protein
MRYGLWSGDRLLGHTDLDVHTVTPTMRQGFIEPTEDGRVHLADATGVWRALAEVKRDARARGDASATDRSLVEVAMRRREELELELRDEDGAVFDCEFIRISDLFDLNNGVVDEMNDTEEEEEARWQIELSALSGEARDEALAQRAEMKAEIDAMVAEMLEEEDEEAAFCESAWPPPPPEDPRWDTMQYLLQVHMKGPDAEEGDG